jgi:hypothetical protein
VKILAILFVFGPIFLIGFVAGMVYGETKAHNKLKTLMDRYNAGIQALKRREPQEALEHILGLRDDYQFPEFTQAPDSVPNAYPDKIEDEDT